MDRPIPGDTERRSVSEAGIEVTGNTLYGLIPFNKVSQDFGGWTEVIEPTAFDNTDFSKLIATVGHDKARLLGRYDKTLKIERRDEGLAWSVELPGGPTGQDLKESLRRGDIDGGSWEMVVAKDRMDSATRTRHVESISELREVTATHEPAYGYEAAPVELRSLFDAQKNTPPAPVEGAPDDAQEAHEMKDETTAPTEAADATKGGGLKVEARSTPENNEHNLEARVIEAMREVPKGESRDITRASSQPIQPEDVASYIFDKLRERSVFLSTGVPIITTSKEKVKIPTLVKDIEVGFYDEGETIVPSDIEFGELTAEPKAIKALARATAEAAEDSTPALLPIVQNNMLTRMALKFDAEALVGGSTHGFTGLAKLSNTQVLDANYEALDSYDMFVAAAGMLAAENVEGPYVCICHPFVATALARIREKFDGEKDSNQLLAAPAGLPQFFTTPQIGLTAAKETKPQFSTVLVYSPSAVRVVRRTEARIDVDYSDSFDSDKVSVRGKARATVAVPYEKGIVRIDHVPAPTISL